MTSTKKPRFPVLEPEVVEAGARRFSGDQEKVPTTSAQNVVWNGVALLSRYSKADELEKMCDMLDILAENASLVAEIYSESKYLNCFYLKLRQCPEEAVQWIAHTLDAFLGGHNGLHLERTDGSSYEVAAGWPEDLLDYGNDEQTDFGIGD